MKNEELTKYDKIFLAISELPSDMQIRLIKGVGKDKSLSYEKAYYTYYALLYKSSLPSFDKQQLLNQKDRILRQKLIEYYRENKTISQTKLSKCLKLGCLPPVLLKTIEYHV